MSRLRQVVLARGAKRMPSEISNNCSPVRWSKYFENQEFVHINNDVFHIYRNGSNNPVLLLIHGGGYSSLTWALFTEEITNKVECQVLAVDLRGHGSTETSHDENLTLDVLAQDVINIVDKVFENNSPPIVIIGHSLGGAVAVAAAACMNNVVGLCVIDVVEGTAVESLSSMQSLLRSRPSGFKSIEQAIQWSFRGGQTHNLDAARVSMPGQIKSIITGQLAANESEAIFNNGTPPYEKKPHISKFLYQKAVIIEEKEEDLATNKTQSCARIPHPEDSPLDTKPPLPPNVTNPTFKIPNEQNMYTWRIDLSKTEQFWAGWFKGLSQNFLNLSIPKVLLLANIHGLDTTLTVGQMQGKFQFQVLPRSGHAIHEDQPQHVADIIAGFVVKQKLAVAKKGFIPLMPAC